VRCSLSSVGVHCILSHSLRAAHMPDPEPHPSTQPRQFAFGKARSRILWSTERAPQDVEVLSLRLMPQERQI
jgi:hypothetical protein